MASQHIEITGTSTRLNGELRRFLDDLQRVKDHAAELKATADQSAFGGDYAGMATAFGFANAADAQAVYNLLGSVNTTLSTDVFIGQILSRCG